MFLSIKQIEPAGLRVEREVHPARITDPEGRPIPFAPVRLQGWVTPRGARFRFRGSFTTTGTFECARCLEPTPIQVQAEFDLLYARQPPMEPAADDAEAAEEARAFMPLCEEGIDLLALVSEQIYLNLPLKPLCSPSCRGLCPQCGANRNAAKCGCGSQAGLKPGLAPAREH
jgi:uncharacterized protein